MKKLDIIIPVYNEDENIIKLLKLLEAEVDCDFRVLICYDNEFDKTLVHLKDPNIIKNEILLIKPFSEVGFAKFSVTFNIITTKRNKTATAPT